MKPTQELVDLFGPRVVKEVHMTNKSKVRGAQIIVDCPRWLRFMARAVAM